MWRRIFVFPSPRGAATTISLPVASEDIRAEIIALWPSEKGRLKIFGKYHLSHFSGSFSSRLRRAASSGGRRKIVFPFARASRTCAACSSFVLLLCLSAIYDKVVTIFFRLFSPYGLQRGQLAGEYLPQGPPEQIPLRIASFCQCAFLPDCATVAIIPRMKL